MLSRWRRSINNGAHQSLWPSRAFLSSPAILDTQGLVRPLNSRCPFKSWLFFCAPRKMNLRRGGFRIFLHYHLGPKSCFFILKCLFCKLSEQWECFFTSRQTTESLILSLVTQHPQCCCDYLSKGLQSNNLNIYTHIYTYIIHFNSILEKYW